MPWIFFTAANTDCLYLSQPSSPLLLRKPHQSSNHPDALHPRITRNGLFWLYIFQLFLLFLTIILSCLRGKQHGLFVELGWAFSGDRQLPPTLNVSLRTFLILPGSVPRRGGEQVGHAHTVQDSPLCPLPWWAWRNHPLRGKNTCAANRRKGLWCPQWSTASSQLVLSSCRYFQISPEFFPAMQKGTKEHASEPPESLCQLIHPGPAIQTPGQRRGVGKGRWGGRRAEGGIVGWSFLVLGRNSSVPARDSKSDI